VRTPVETADHGLMDTKRVHQRDDIDCEGRLLPIADGGPGEEAGGAVAAQIGNDHPVTGGRENGRDIGVAMNVIRPAVEQDDGRVAGIA
jgi:hypothetical protein